MYPETSNNLNRETDKEVYFFTPAFYPLDNFSAHTVKIWGKIFPTSEHAFQWKKFSDSYPELAESILTASSPHMAKEIADQNKNKIASDWHEKRVVVMEEILKVKVKQHEDVQDALRRTRNRLIIENSPVDSFWGIGPDRNGENMLGKIWMKIRNIV